MAELIKCFESEYRFCEILWENEPITSSELVRPCSEAETTYKTDEAAESEIAEENENSEEIMRDYLPNERIYIIFYFNEDRQKKRSRFVLKI